jgi:hypothetical protein
VAVSYLLLDTHAISTPDITDLIPRKYSPVWGSYLPHHLLLAHSGWAWKISYNEERRHAALGNIPPMEFKRLVTAEVSSNELCA